MTGIVAVAVVAAAGMGAQGDAAAHVAGPHAPHDSPLPSPDRHVVHPLHEGYTPPLHPSVLHLSDYPPSGSGEAADLEFTMTYMGGWEEDAAANWRTVGDHPPVRLDVTGSGHEEMYLVTNITSNIGASDPDVFAPYDHETEATVAEPGRTYTVRAQIEFVAEGFLPVHAFGLDGDIITVNVAASAGLSMPYYEYVATGEDYLDHLLAAPGPVEARERPLDLESVAILESRHGGSLKDMLSPVGPDGLPVPFSESSMPLSFDMAGRVTTVDFDLDGRMPVHGIRVCVYDLSYDSGTPIYTLLNTTGDMPACDYTDNAGAYSITGISGIDPYDMSRADPFVAVHSFGYGGLIDLLTYEYGYYYAYVHRDIVGAVFEHVGGPLVRNIDIQENSFGMDGAARIISVMSDGMAYFERHGHMPAPLIIYWHYADGASVFPDRATTGAAYLQGYSIMWLDGSSIGILDDSVDRHTMLHELAHHVHTIHDPGLDFNCIPHWYDRKHDERCAWGEGWAQLVPHLVYNSATLSSGPERTWFNIEAAGLGPASGLYPTTYSFYEEPSGRPIGDKVEGRVAAAMWDMADSIADPIYDNDLSQRSPYNLVDDVAAGPGAVVGLFFSGTYDTFAEFYDRWEIDMRHQSAENIAFWHGMSFVIPNDIAYYQFVGELDGVFDRGRSGLRFEPNYIDVSADNSTIAVTSYRGQGIQLINASDGSHLGLHATRGYDHDCMLEYSPISCLLERGTDASTDLGYGKFVSMDGIALDPSGRFMLVTDGLSDRVHILHADGRHAGQFGTPGDGEGIRFDTPDGAAFLPNGTAAVADTGNRSVQLFNIAPDGSGATHTGQFESYKPYLPTPIRQHQYTTQQLATGPDGSLHAADFRYPSMWAYPQGLEASGTVVRTDDMYNWRPGLRGGLAGIAVGQDGLVYASNHQNGYVRVYNLSATVDVSTGGSLGVRPLEVQQAWSTAGIVDEFGSRGVRSWQLYQPFGVALGPPADTASAVAGDMRVYVADHIGVKMYERDRARPTVSAVWSHTPDSSVVAGGIVELAVNFSERITVTGAPVMEINAGGSAAYVSGSGSPTLTFNYTVPAVTGPMYLDYLGTDSLRLSGINASVMDGSGNDADLSLPALGTAGSLAANSALWAYGSGQAAVPPLAIPRGPPAVAAVEGTEVRFNVNATGAPDTYSIIGRPAGANLGTGGMFSWTPSEGQDGLHAFVVNASSQGGSAIRAFRVLVAEDNQPPRMDPIPDMSVSELSELRFTVSATDDDLPAQRLQYRLDGGPAWGPTILPNGTFVWTPSTYHDGETHTFNVTVSDGFGGGEGRGGSGGAGTASALFNVTVVDVPQDVEAITVAGVFSLVNGTYGMGDTVFIVVEFSDPVRVTGSPELRLDVGAGQTAVAAYNASSGRFVYFAYTVEAGHAAADLDYSGTGSLSASGGSTILAASGEDVVELALPGRGDAGSLAQTSSVVIDATRDALRIGVIGDGPAGGAAEAVRLAADEFGTGPDAILPLIVTTHGGTLDASTVVNVLEDARADGTGPGVFVGPLDDATLQAAAQHANARGIMLVSTASTAQSLAEPNDLVFRLLPGNAMQETALAGIVREFAPDSIYVVVDEDAYGQVGPETAPPTDPPAPDAPAPVPLPPPVVVDPPVSPAGQAEPPAPGSSAREAGSTFAALISPVPVATIGLSGPGSGWVDDAEALAGSVRSAGNGTAAVVFLGPPDRLDAFAEHAVGHADLRSTGWFTAAPPGAPPPGLGASLSALAAQTSLTAVSWDLPASDAARRIDARLSALGVAVPGGIGAYAAYDAAALIARAAGTAATEASPVVIAAALPAATAGYTGALGNVSLNEAGDLAMPDGYGVWTARDGDGGSSWERRPGLVSGTRLSNVTVPPSPPITVVGVSAPSGAYGTGDNVTIAVNFSAPVAVYGSAELLLNVGSGRNASAVHNGGNGSVVFFAYAVQDGHYSIDLEYAGTDALRVDGDGAGILPAWGAGAVALALPEPGGQGSLSRTSNVFVRTSQDVLDIGVIGHANAGGAAEAARLAAADFGAGPAGMLLLNITVYGGMLDASTVVDVLETAYAGGAGPGVFVGPLDDRTLRAAVQYANDTGIVLVSTNSSTPSLAVPGDRVIRLSADDAMRATALAGLVSRLTPTSIHVVVDEDHYGPASRSAAMPPAQGSFLQWYAEAFVPYAFPSPQEPIGLSGSSDQWADEAADLAAAAGTPGTGRAVAFFGPLERLAVFAGHADDHNNLLSARWFTAVPPGSPIDLAGSLSTFATRTNLTAVSWTVPTNDVTGRIDSRLSMLGTAAGSVDSYASYDAVSVLGRAAAEAGAGAGADGIIGALPAALAGYEGALGDISVDEATGDLALPGNYTVWTAGAGADGTDWEAQPARVDAVPTCGAYLSPQDFGLRVVPGGISDPSAQAVVNSGWFPIRTVELGASMWTGGAAGGMWPASLTEVSRGGSGGTYAPLSGTTAFAENVGIGASAPAWFRINTTGADVPQSGTIEQTVTYTLAC